MTPTYATLDIGLPGGALNPTSAQTSVRVEVGELTPAASSFGFVGFQGTFRQVMGPAARQAIWSIVLRCIDLATLNSIEASIDALVASGGVGTLTDTQGRAHYNAAVKSYAGQQGYDTIRGGTLAGWIRKEGKITFEVTTP